MVYFRGLLRVYSGFTKADVVAPERTQSKPRINTEIKLDKIRSGTLRADATFVFGIFKERERQVLRWKDKHGSAPHLSA